jgi:hypothetical protein
MNEVKKEKKQKREERERIYINNMLPLCWLYRIGRG